MHRATDASSTPAHGPSSSGSPQRAAASTNGGSVSPGDAEADGHICPFCGLTHEFAEDFDPTAPCPRCTLADTPTTRNATKARVGPWHVRQMRNPWAPGMRWETLLALIKRGQVTKDSVVRGPTSHQLWKRASEIKGLSREFGVCYSCGGDIDTQANLCGHCNRLQEPPVNPNVLVETRDGANPETGGVADADRSAPAPAVPQPARPNGKRARQHADALDETPHMEISSSTAGADLDDMLTVEDPERTAAIARAVTSRPPQRPNRPTSTNLPPAAPTPEKSEPTPPPASRPVALRPRQPGADDALLTPQELAAAFQLNFTPPPTDSSPGAAPAPADRPRQPRRKRSKLFGMFVMLVLVAAGAAALFYLRPDLREQASEWSDSTYASVKEFISSRTAPAAPTLDPVSPPPPTTRPSTGTRGSTAVVQTPTMPRGGRSAAREPIVAAPAPAPRPKPVAVADPQPAPSPMPAPSAPLTRETVKELEPRETPESPAKANEDSITASAKTVTAPTVAPVPPAPTPASVPVSPPPPPPVEIIKIAPPVTPATSATATTPTPPPSAPATAAANAKARAAQTAPATPKVWTNLTEAEDEARRLWRLAFDAEQNQDFVEAVALYEQIKQLPSGVHPAGLEVRLSLAKKLMK